jgi:hypothetical protein
MAAYRERAGNCLEWARKAQNEEARAVWSKMAQLWMKRAEEANERTNVEKQRELAD